MSLSPNTLPDPVQPLDSGAAVAPPALRDPVWNLWDVLMIVVVALGGMLLFGTLIGLGLHFAGIPIPQEMSPLMLRIELGAQCLAYLLVLLFMYYLVTGEYGRGFAEAVRWTAPPPRVWPYYLAGGVALSFFVGLIGRIVPFPPHLPIDKYFQDRTSAWLLTIFGITLAPLVEELFYRGFVYPALARRVGMTAGTMITAAAFALMHSAQLAHAWGPLFILFLVGLALTVVRIVSRSVVPGVLMHMAYNATLFTMLYIASDGYRHLEKVLQ